MPQPTKSRVAFWPGKRAEGSEKPPVPAYVATARASCACMTDAQRVAFAAELVRDVTDTSCRLQLRRLIALAQVTAAELDQIAFARGDIV
jgi:hypothetical protein